MFYNVIYYQKVASPNILLFIYFNSFIHFFHFSLTIDLTHLWFQIRQSNLNFIILSYFLMLDALWTFYGVKYPSMAFYGLYSNYKYFITFISQFFLIIF